MNPMEMEHEDSSNRFLELPLPVSAQPGFCSTKLACQNEDLSVLAVSPLLSKVVMAASP